MTPDLHPHDLLGQQDGVLAEWIGVCIRASTITPEWIERRFEKKKEDRDEPEESAGKRHWTPAA